MSLSPDSRRLHKSLKFRSDLLHAIRSFFRTKEVIEVTTPVRIPTPALEEHIDAEPSGSWYLRTSPELHMKRLLQKYSLPIFQIGPCFRQHEMGKIHRPEFTMLEWYLPNADYRQLLAQTQELLIYIVMELFHKTWINYQETKIHFTTPWMEYDVTQTINRFTQKSPKTLIADGQFEMILVEKIEPSLPKNVPVILIDYPIELGALARTKPSHPELTERWELYIGGIEIANAYSELINAGEQRQRFVRCLEKRRNANRPVYKIDEDFLASLDNDMPPCTGCALGIDRLQMILMNAISLSDIIDFDVDEIS